MKLSDIPMPTGVFFQPVRYQKMLADSGVTVAFGPEVEDSKALASKPDELLAKEAEWMLAARALGIGVVIKRPWKYGTLPDNVVGFMHSDDEPNADKTPAANLKAEYDRLRGIDPKMPIFLSLYGGGITSANLAKPVEFQYHKDLAALCDIAVLDCYSMNVNARTHPTAWTGDAVAKWIAATGKPAWAWVEINDQRLTPPKPEQGFNRAPTAEEIKATVDYAVGVGATGIAWFATCQAGKYGWGIVDPAKGDSYWPLIDRNGASIKPQLDMVKAIGLSRKPIPPPLDPLTLRVAKLETDLAAARASADAAKASADAANAVLARIGAAFPATMPAK